MTCDKLAAAVDRYSAEVPEPVLPEEFVSTYRLTPYYKKLTIITKILGVKNYCELGVRKGLSLACAALSCETCVGYDRIHHEIVQDFVKYPGVTLVYCPEEKSVLDADFSQYDFIFVDIDHGGLLELEIHEKLLKQFRGFTLYDDVNHQWPAMLKFWDCVKQDKTLVPWNYQGNTMGLVYYPPGMSKGSLAI